MDRPIDDRELLHYSPEELDGTLRQQLEAHREKGHVSPSGEIYETTLGVGIAVNAYADALEALEGDGRLVSEAQKAAIFEALLRTHVGQWPKVYFVHLMAGRLNAEQTAVEFDIHDEPGGHGGTEASRSTEPAAIVGGISVPVSTITSISGPWYDADDHKTWVYEISTSAGLRGWMTAQDVFEGDGFALLTNPPPGLL